ncbi:MAG: hypothetical protein ACTSRC_15020 [Candidatus Helarchaeota archaeon]
MGESSSDYPFYEGWWKWAEPINKFLVWATLGLVIAAWALSGLGCIPGYCIFFPSLLVRNLWRLILSIVGVIIYLIMTYKPLKNKDLTKKMHIGLLITFVLVEVVSYWWWAGLLVTLQFVMVGILSDRPFWVAFSEGDK